MKPKCACRRISDAVSVLSMIRQDPVKVSWLSRPWSFLIHSWIFTAVTILLERSMELFLFYEITWNHIIRWNLISYTFLHDRLREKNLSWVDIFEEIPVSSWGLPFLLFQKTCFSILISMLMLIPSVLLEDHTNKL